MGLATAGGGLLALNPLALLIAVGVLVTLILILRHGAKATIFAALLITPVFWLFNLRGMILWMAGFFALIISIRFLSDWNRKYRELWLDREKK
jgi:glycerol-3-phosphate acyltransferase PlsY